MGKKLSRAKQDQGGMQEAWKMLYIHACAINYA